MPNRHSFTNCPNTVCICNYQCLLQSRTPSSKVTGQLLCIHGALNQQQMVLGIKSPPPTEVYKGSILPGLFRLSTLCVVPLRTSSIIRTFPIMNFCIHPSGRLEGPLGLTVCQPSTATNPLSFYPELCSGFASIRASPTM